MSFLAKNAGSVLSDKPKWFFELDNNAAVLEDNDVIVAYYNITSDGASAKIGTSQSYLTLQKQALCQRLDGTKALMMRILKK